MAHYKSTVIRNRRPEPSSNRKGDREDRRKSDREDVQGSTAYKKRGRFRMGTVEDFADSLFKNNLATRMYRKAKRKMLGPARTVYSQTARKNLAYDPR